MSKPKPRKQHKKGTVELWGAFTSSPVNSTNLILVHEDGSTEFMWSWGVWYKTDNANPRSKYWTNDFEYLGEI